MSFIPDQNQTSFVPDAQQQQLDGGFHPADYLMSLYHNAVDPTVGAMETVVGAPLEGIARVGRFADQGNQQLMDMSAEKLGQMGVNPYLSAAITTPLAATSAALMPKDKLGAFLTLAGAGGESAGASDLPTAEQSITKVVKPGPIANTAGAAVSASTAIPQRYAAAVAADTSILSDKTPDTTEVSKKYIDYFEKKAANLPDAIKKWTGKDYFPGDNEIGRLEDTINNVKTALTETKNIPSESDQLGQYLSGSKPSSANIPDKLTPEELFTGRSAAAAALRSNKAAINPAFHRWAQDAQNTFDQALEEQGHGELKDLGRQWFRAKAKESFQSLLPQNKNMSPNALRSTLMLNELMKAATGPFQGGILKQSVPAMVRATALSPYMMGNAMQAADSSLQLPGQILSNSLSPYAALAGRNALSDQGGNQ